MSIVWLILKIIGLLLLAIVGLLLLVVVLVLLVPVRYRIRGKVDADDDIVAELGLNWLCHLVSYRLLYQDKELHKKLKIFGIPLKGEGKSASAKKDKKPKKEKKKRKEEKKEKDQEEMSRPMEVPKDGFMENMPDAPEDGFMENMPEVPEDGSVENVPKMPEDGRDIEQTPESPHKKISSGAGAKGQKRFRRPSFFKKLKALPGMIKSKLETIIEKVRDIRELISRIREVWKDEANRSALKLIWREVKGFLKVLLPRRATVDAAFSTGEPDTTGQVLGVVSMLPFIYRYRIRLVPDFEAENFYFRGTFDIKGHIYGFHLALLLYHLYRDKNIRGLIQRYRNSQED